MRPKRISMGRYAVEVNGKRIVLQRCGRSGFRIIQRPGAISPMVKRLRDAVIVALESASPWPFDLPNPNPLKRTA